MGPTAQGPAESPSGDRRGNSTPVAAGSLHLRRAEAERWLDVAYGDRSGYVAVAFGVAPYRNASGAYVHRRWTPGFYAWPRQRGALLADVAQRLADADMGGDLVDVYVCPHLRTDAHRTGPSQHGPGNAAALMTLHGDLDGPPLEPVRLAALDPLTTDSGTPGHSHVLIALDEPVDPDRWSQLQRALRDLTGADDKIAHNDVLRLPGTVNAKATAPREGEPGAPTPVTSRPGWSGRVWSLAEVAERLGVDLSQPPPRRVTVTDLVDAPQTVPLPDPLPRRVREAAEAFAAATDKSSAWARLVGCAAAAQLSRDEAFAVAVRFGLPHLPRYRGREVGEFDRAWVKALAWLAERPATELTRDDVRKLADEGWTAAQARALVDGVDRTLWRRLDAADLFTAPAGSGLDAVADRGADVAAPIVGQGESLPPREQVAAFICDLRTWQMIPDPTGHLAALACAVTAEDGEGDPPWLLVVSGPSSGKTEIVRLLDVVAQARLDDVSVGGLLSWSRGKKPVPRGVLAEVTRGVITLGDLSTLLAGSDHGGRDEVFALLRRVADGEVNRNVAPPSGATVDTSLQWRGRIHLVAAVTGVVDRYANHNASLGDRWLSYRQQPLTPEQARQASRMCRARELPGRRAQAAKTFAEIVAAARDHLDDETSDELAGVVQDCAQVAAWGRAAVPRSTSGRREIEDVAIVEEPMRLAAQLEQMALGLLALGLDDAETAAVVRRLAVDSMPSARRAVLVALVDQGEPVSTAAAARVGGLHWNVASRRLEELATVGVVEMVGLTDEGAEGAAAVVGEAEEPPDRRVSCRWRLAPSVVDLVSRVVGGLTSTDVSHKSGVGPT